MNSEELKKIKDNLSLVTIGPWKSFIEGRDHSSGSSFIRTGDKDYDIEFDYLRPNDQDFIAMARNLLPELIDEILRLQKILAENEIQF